MEKREAWVLGLVVFIVVLVSWHGARADGIAEIPDKILSQCGLVSALLVVAIVWLSTQLAKTRAAWETDRNEWFKALNTQNTSRENLSVSNAKLEGIILAIQHRH